MKRLPLLAALSLLCASALSAQPLMSVGYFNGGGDVTAGPGGDIDKLGRPADHPSQLLVWPYL
ncbi:chitinase [Klebsiella pneumoniae]|uniref:Chitinase n=1 Tax=Klebsiella pneumoniae TaxID=573 RepID=A0A378F6S1_KLEPN|nr:chitinase [Klebsiella pneumoniae]